ncbi:hypothetical protein [Chromobacterium sp. IIBBL 290-4]|nr:hypothetical protein [Chromobacterium sp. IIBBL 290-4]UTH74653.1 hypothetical protein NKT35_00615 [Chromobacterium sp. IIBBL 290-4]
MKKLGNRACLQFCVNQLFSAHLSKDSVRRQAADAWFSAKAASHAFVLA